MTMTPYEWLAAHPWIGVAVAVLSVVALVDLIMVTRR